MQNFMWVDRMGRQSKAHGRGFLVFSNDTIIKINPANFKFPGEIGRVISCISVPHSSIPSNAYYRPLCLSQPPAGNHEEPVNGMQ